jgi:hypothetical protein
MGPTRDLARIVVYNESPFLIKGEPQDILAEQGVIACSQAVAGALSRRYEVQRVPIHADVEVALAPYSPAEWAVFNLGEGIQGRLFEEARIAWALEAMGYHITGSRGDALARSIHKVHAKQLFARAGIPTPRWHLCRSVAEAEDSLGFPLIVKPMAEERQPRNRSGGGGARSRRLESTRGPYDRVLSSGHAGGGVHRRPRVQRLPVGRPAGSAPVSLD